MALELHIFPPLFSLPSISGSCVAALSLCNLFLDNSAFQVVESTDLSIGLPALKDGENWYHGYTAIKSYLSKQNHVDEHLTLAQKADVVAWGSLIEDLGDTLAVRNKIYKYYSDIKVKLVIRITPKLPRHDKTRNFFIPPISSWFLPSNTITNIRNPPMRRNWNG